MGLNRMMHFPIESDEKWHALGDRLAPKEGWNGILGGRPGMAGLDIVAVLPDDEKTPFRIKVQPSVRVKPHGAYFETNEHHNAPESDGLRSLIATMRARWEAAQKYAYDVANHILEWSGRPTDEQHIPERKGRV
jgi:hypothetical protein